ncbi:MAG: DUF4405 domain-containing protein [Deltaproteobacteria bacterium]|nr:DUF4405 domain-containing protein [Candidatus Zymogenaceae bacterium]
MMDKNKINFWIDAATFVVFVILVFTGFLLYTHAFGGSGREGGFTIGGLSWKDIHMIASLVFLALIIVHLVFHRSWGATCGKKYTGVGLWILGALMGLLLLAAVCVPFFFAGEHPGGNGYRGGRGVDYGIESNLSGFNRGPGPGRISGDVNLKTVEIPAKTAPGTRAGGHRWGKNR